MSTNRYRIVRHQYGRQHIEWHVLLGDTFMQRFWYKRDAIAWILKQEAGQ